MSSFLDVNGDGEVTKADALVPNDVKGDGMNSFQVQNPADHWYASSTGDPGDCPQPDLSLTPGAEGDFGPDPQTSPRRSRATSATAPETRAPRSPTSTP